MNVTLNAVGSLSELQEQLRKCSQCLMLGGNDESPRDFFIFSILNCDIGICSQGHGIPPSTLCNKQTEKLWVGYNAKVSSINIDTCQEIFTTTLNGLFYEFAEHIGDDSVVVIHELGACRISDSGEIIWDHSGDVVTGFSVTCDTVHINTDENDFVIDKLSGEVISVI